MGCDFAQLLQNSNEAAPPVAVAPHWPRADFVQAALSLSARLQAAKHRSAALWFDDAARFACALLACAHARVAVYLPPNLAADNRQWADDAADVWLADVALPEAAKPVWCWDDNSETVLSGSLYGRETPLCLDTRVYLKTSGSSGQAQVVSKTLAQLQAEATALQQTWALPAPGTVVAGSVAPQHLYGLTFRIVLALCAGWPLWRQQCVYPESLLEATAAVGSCVWVASPTLLTALATHGLPENLAAQVVQVFSAGGALPETTAAALASRLPQAVQEIYGSTETGVIAQRQYPQPWRFFAALAHETDAEGVLRVQSPWSGGWQQTADAVQISADANSFELLGRQDRIIKLADKRVSLTQIEHSLLQHPWVADAHCGVHPTRRRVAAWVALNGAGVAAWCAQGRAAVVAALQQQLAHSQDAVARPRHWRFDTALPRNSQGKLAAADFSAALAQRPLAPLWQPGQCDHADEMHFHAVVPLDLRYFSGHFDTFPLVPGVVQLQWALAQARQALGLAAPVARVENLKYQQFLRPADTVNLHLHWQADKQKLLFKLDNGSAVCASGRVVFASTKDKQA